MTSPRTPARNRFGERLGAAKVAHHRPYALTVRGELADDVAADEPSRSGDEDGHARSKFFQYRLGVGPRWPWYFEPILG